MFGSLGLWNFNGQTCFSKTFTGSTIRGAANGASGRRSNHILSS